MKPAAAEVPEPMGVDDRLGSIEEETEAGSRITGLKRSAPRGRDWSDTGTKKQERIR
jgi:hypothetical protein